VSENRLCDNLASNRVYRPLRHIDEILMLCHWSAVEESSPANRSNLTLIVAQPSASLYQL